MKRVPRVDFLNMNNLMHDMTDYRETPMDSFITRYSSSFPLPLRGAVRASMARLYMMLANAGEPLPMPAEEVFREAEEEVNKGLKDIVREIEKENMMYMAEARGSPMIPEDVGVHGGAIIYRAFQKQLKKEKPSEGERSG
ncbi:MAG: hypothetical protein HY520_04415 [Candidatus Aenigmarchaeota archaeon]|nr:hypothetical protein [Candidatus Aenigmarchaeota archaeon]